jgi:hypothetical protein
VEHLLAFAGDKMKIEERNNWERREIMEDKLLNDDVISYIEYFHDCKVFKIFRHFEVDGKEIDAILYARTKKRNLIRKIGVELKENNVLNAVYQALERSKYFNYFYIITNVPFPAEEFRWLIIHYPDTLRKMVLNKVGIISVFSYEKGFTKGSVILNLLPAKFNKNAVEIEYDKKLKEFLGDNE